MDDLRFGDSAVAAARAGRKLSLPVRVGDELMRRGRSKTVQSGGSLRSPVPFSEKGDFLAGGRHVRAREISQNVEPSAMGKPISGFRASNHSAPATKSSTASKSPMNAAKVFLEITLADNAKRRPFHSA